MPYLISGAALALLFFLVLSLRRRAPAAAAPRQGASATSSIFHDLRAQAFATDPALVGIPDPVPGTRNGVWGFAMEIGSPEGCATLVALGDGSASLYLERGGGLIGAGRHERVHRAAVAAVETADARAWDGEAVTLPPLPRAREVRFHWLGRDGLRSAAAPRAKLETAEHPLTELFAAGNAVITAIREAEGGQ